MNTTRFFLFGVGVLGAAFVFWLTDAQDDARPAASPAREAAGIAETRERTVADAWTLPAAAARQVEPDERRTASDAPRIDSGSVRAALRDVRLDEAGNAVVDHHALAALRDGFASIDQLDVAQLTELQDIIRKGLPPPAGEQAATIVGNYYQYQVAAQTMLGGNAGRSIGGSEAQLERLIALRESYFGAETAAKLFGDEQAYARFTLESMRIASDESLSSDEKQQRQDALSQMLPARLQEVNALEAHDDRPPVHPSEHRPDFPMRFAEFERQREAILAAGLADQDKDAQLERLLHEHFAADEIDLALRYDAQRPTSERR